MHLICWLMPLPYGMWDCRTEMHSYLYIINNDSFSKGIWLKKNLPIQICRAKPFGNPLWKREQEKMTFTYINIASAEIILHTK